MGAAGSAFWPARREARGERRVLGCSLPSLPPSLPPCRPPTDVPAPRRAAARPCSALAVRGRYVTGQRLGRSSSFSFLEPERIEAKRGSPVSGALSNLVFVCGNPCSSAPASSPVLRSASLPATPVSEHGVPPVSARGSCRSVGARSEVREWNPIAVRRLLGERTFMAASGVRRHLPFV